MTGSETTALFQEDFLVSVQRMRTALQPLRDGLPKRLRERLENELGLEECLRVLWPAVAGPALAAHTRFHALRGECLVVRVPDHAWRSSLDSLAGLLLEGVNRSWGKAVVRSVTCLEDNRMPARPLPERTSQPPGASELTPLMQTAALIPDAALRASFLDSAQKYLARREELRS